MATLDDFLDEVSDLVTKYTKDVLKELETRLDETADKIFRVCNS